MRISDWSSDVCSSDLRRRGHDEAQPAADGEKAADDHLTELVGFAPLAAVPGVEGGDRDEHREAHPRVGRDHPACRDRRAEEGELEMLEIGRASCRERVCQYV